MNAQHTPAPWVYDENKRLKLLNAELLEACQFVTRYAAMKADKGEPLPSQCVMH